ncbi:myelin-oligodendrocyte glycoprotein-like isoform X2 [Antennarius striatus]|uniref:myelin-oligodendrocyte glycoprotein-like isoform X2 n=1 Tax=Antennarius striatus TaxID=241820 RepID=UPI0035B10BFF
MEPCSQNRPPWGPRRGRVCPGSSVLVAVGGTGSGECSRTVMTSDWPPVDGRSSENVVVTVTEGQDAFLPCTISPLEDLSWKVFDWMKEEKNIVFLYEEGFHNNKSDHQDPQFKGRVSHFPEELVNGNASIVIRNMTPGDGGNYTCVFPRLSPPQTYPIRLVVEPSLKDLNLSTEIPGPPLEDSSIAGKHTVKFLSLIVALALVCIGITIRRVRGQIDSVSH